MENATTIRSTLSLGFVIDLQNYVDFTKRKINVGAKK